MILQVCGQIVASDNKAKSALSDDGDKRFESPKKNNEGV